MASFITAASDPLMNSKPDLKRALPNFLEPAASMCCRPRPTHARVLTKQLACLPNLRGEPTEETSYDPIISNSQTGDMTARLPATNQSAASLLQFSPKLELNNMFQKIRLVPQQLKYTTQTSTSNRSLFESHLDCPATFLHPECTNFNGFGSSKKEAEHNVASQALRFYKDKQRVEVSCGTTTTTPDTQQPSSPQGLAGSTDDLPLGPIEFAVYISLDSGSTVNRSTTKWWDEHKLQQLQQRIGYAFRRPALLRLAMVHGSAGGGDSFTRLALLGDKCVSLALMNNLIMSAMPASSTGELTQLHDRLLSRAQLAKNAEVIGLGECLVVGSSLDVQHLPHNVLAEAWEALFGAVFIDCGSSLEQLTGVYLHTCPLDV